MSKNELVQTLAKSLFKDDWPKDNWERFKEGDVVYNRYMSLASTALRTIKSSGYAIVPLEPTEQMADLAYDLMSVDTWTAEKLYATMIDAAPDMT